MGGRQAGRGRWLALGVLVTGLLIAPPSARAWQGPAHKLVRGVVNVATAWLALPLNIYEGVAATNILEGSFRGFCNGFARGFLRVGAGLYDVATFPIPIPPGYRPVLYPEFLLQE